MFPAVYKEMFPSCRSFHFLFFSGGCTRVCSYFYFAGVGREGRLVTIP